MMKECKALLKEIRKKKELEAEKSHHFEGDVYDENRPRCAGERKYGVCPTKSAQGGFRCAGLGAPDTWKGSMMSRFRALERNAAFNQNMMQGHRTFLDSKAGRQQDGSGVGRDMDQETCGANETWAEGGDNAVMISDLPTGDIEAAVELLWTSSTHNVSTIAPLRPASAASAASRHRLSRPVSASSISAAGVEIPAHKLPRPFSACSLSSAGIQSVPDEVSCRTRPSRPESANSISGRFAAIEENLRRNRAMMQVNREDMITVKKEKQEKAQASSNFMAKELAMRPTSEKLLEDLVRPPSGKPLEDLMTATSYSRSLAGSEN